MEKNEVPPAYGYGSSPPSYPPQQPNVQYAYAQTTPLISQPGSTVIVTESKSGSTVCGCAIGVFMCIAVCCCCVVCAAILGGVFGYWGVQCANREFYKTIGFTHEFSTGSESKLIQVKTPGIINFQTTPSVPNNGLVASCNVSAGSLENANDIDIDTYQTAQLFELEAENSWWYCPLVDIDINLSQSLNGLLNLELKSYYGEIYVTSPGIMYEKVDVTTNSGDIRIRSVIANNHVITKTLNGNVDVEIVSGDELELETSNGDILVKDIQGEEINIETSFGDISGNAISLLDFSRGNCELEVTTSNGEIFLDAIQLPNLIDCDLDIRSLSGQVTVTVRDFFGTFELSPLNGDSIVNGVRYDGKTSGNVEGPRKHTIYIKSNSGDVYLNF